MREAREVSVAFGRVRASEGAQGFGYDKAVLQTPITELRLRVGVKCRKNRHGHGDRKLGDANIGRQTMAFLACRCAPLWLLHCGLVFSCCSNEPPARIGMVVRHQPRNIVRLDVGSKRTPP